MNSLYNNTNQMNYSYVPSQDTCQETQKSSKSTKFVCPVPDCQKIFRFRSDMQRHLPVHSNTRPHVCDHYPCTRAFKRVDALQDHIRSQHTHEASLVCPYIGCGERFTTNAKLRYHSALHNTNKPHTCNFEGCDKAFVTLSQLKQHQKSLMAHRNLSPCDSIDYECRKLASDNQSSCRNSDLGETAPNTGVYSTQKKFKSDVDSDDQVSCFFGFDSMAQSPCLLSTEQTLDSEIFSPKEVSTTYNFRIQESLKAAVNENDMLKAQLEMNFNTTESLKQQLEQALILLSQSAQTGAAENNVSSGFENFKNAEQNFITYENEQTTGNNNNIDFNLDFDFGSEFDFLRSALSRSNSRF